MPRLRNSSALMTAADSLMALGIAVSSVMLLNARSAPSRGLAQFLIIRITLLNASFSIVFVVLWKQCLAALGLYRRELEGLRSSLIRAAAACTIMTGLLYAYLRARDARGPAEQILLSFFVATFLFEISRLLVCSNCRSWHTRPRQRVIIVGSGRQASKAWRALRIGQHGTKQLLGFVDDRPSASMPPDIASRLLGNIDELPAYLIDHAVDEIIVATPLRSCYDEAQRALSIAEAAGIRVVVCLDDLFTLTTEKSARRQETAFVEVVPSSAKRDVIAQTAPAMLKRSNAVS